MLFEDSGWQGFLPLTLTRTVADLRVGADTIRAQLAAVVDAQVGVWARPAGGGGAATTANEPIDLYLARGWWHRVPAARERPWLGMANDTVAFIAADATLASRLQPDALLNPAAADEILAGVPRYEVNDCVAVLDWWWQLLDVNTAALAALPPGVHVDASADVRHGAVLDATDGPIHVGAGATIHGTAHLQGPCAIGRDCVILPQASIRAGSSVGPTCKVGGEVEESILIGYSNKQHHGYLGHSVVGSWVNLGAGTTTSDLKSTYGTVSTTVPGGDGELTDTGRQFLGAVIGDHAKTAIDTGINAGTAIGVATAIFNRSCPAATGSFRWITETGATSYDIERAISVARRVMQRRGKHLSAVEEERLRTIATH